MNVQRLHSGSCALRGLLSLYLYIRFSQDLQLGYLRAVPRFCMYNEPIRNWGEKLFLL